MENQISEKNPILVTGATGHTGRRLVAALLDKGLPVRILTRGPARLDVKLRRRIEVIRGDLLNPEIAQEAMAGSSAVIALTHIKLAPTVIGAMKTAGVRRGIFVSSTRRYTRFVEETALQVIAGEQAVETSGLDWTIIRPTMIYGGPQDRNLRPLLDTLKKWPVFPLPDGGRMLWQPVFTWDVVAALISALERPASIEKAYTIAGPEALTYRQMIETMIREAGLKTRLVSVPLGAIRPAIAIYEKLSREPRVQMDQIRRMQENKDFDISDARRDLAFDPISFEEGIRRKVRGTA